MNLIIYLCAATLVIWSILSIVTWFRTRNDVGVDDVRVRGLLQQRVIDFGLPVFGLVFVVIAIVVRDIKILAILCLGAGYAALQINSHYSTQWQLMKRRNTERD